MWTNIDAALLDVAAFEYGVVVKRLEEAAHLLRNVCALVRSWLSQPEHCALRVAKPSPVAPNSAQVLALV